MPHKHKRDKSKNDSFYDLPPTSIARPLSVHNPPPKPQNPKPARPRNKPTPVPQKILEDDTPRAFKRLMTGYKPPPGLDTSCAPPPKKQKRKPPPSTSTSTSTHPPPPLPPQNPPLKIHPSEPLSTFSARVDAALPISHLSRSTRSHDPTGLTKTPQTKTERKLQKMQQEWREGARRRKEREEEARDEAEVESDHPHHDHPAFRRAKPKSKPLVAVDDDDDPWSSISSSKPTSTSTSKSSGLIGLHDVVLAPPKLVVPREKLGIAARVKGSKKQGVRKPITGGLKRQSDLSESRRRIIEGYREMMRKRKNGNA